MSNLFDTNFVRSNAIIGTPGFGFSSLVDLHPQVAVLADVSGQTPGRAIAVWDSGPSGIQGRVVGSNGNTLGGPVPIALGATETMPDIAAFPGSTGKSVVTWQSTAGGTRILAEILTAGGTPTGTVIPVQTSPFAMNAKVATLTNGNFVVVWQDQDPTGAFPDASGFGIHGKIFDINGVQQGSEFTVNDITGADQTLPDIAALSSGDFAVTWQDASDLADSRAAERQ